MKKRFLITAANTDCGKTHITLELISALGRLGVKIGAIKPIETGVENEPADGIKLLQALRSANPVFNAVPISDIVPITYPLPAAPFIAKKAPVDYGLIEEKIAHLEQFCDIILIESAGGLMTPLDETLFVKDLAKKLKATVIYVAKERLGMISETLTNLKLLEDEAIPYRWLINGGGDKTVFNEINGPYFDYRFGSYYYLPEDLDDFLSEVIL